MIAAYSTSINCYPDADCLFHVLCSNEMDIDIGKTCLPDVSGN